MDSTEGRRGAMPPYVPFRTWKTHLADLKAHGVPGRIDSDVLKKLPGSTARQLKTGMRFLGLTDADDRPTDDLHKLTHAFGTDQWIGALAGLLGARYGEFLSGINLAQATPSQFREHFRAAYKPADEMARKCEGFFLQAAQEAGLDISKRIPIIIRQRSAGGGKHKATAKVGQEGRGRNNQPPPPNNMEHEDDDPRLDLDPLLIEMLRRIPARGDDWPKEQRLRWFKTFAMNVTEIYDEPTDPIDLDISLATPSGRQSENY